MLLHMGSDFMEKTSVQMEQDMLNDLDKIAEKRGMNRSQVIRKFLEEKIQESKDEGEIK